MPAFAAVPASDRPDDRHEASRVHEEQRSGAGGRVERATEGRSYRSAQVLVDRLQRDRLCAILRRDELRLQRLPRGRGERLSDADREDQREQHPRRDQPRERQNGQREGRDQHERLRRDQQPATIDEIADRARGHGEQHDRETRRRLDQRHQRRRRRQRQHQLLCADRLHPAADVAHELRRGHPRESAGAKRRPRRRAGFRLRPHRRLDLLARRIHRRRIILGHGFQRVRPAAGSHRVQRRHHQPIRRNSRAQRAGTPVLGARTARQRRRPRHHRQRAGILDSRPHLPAGVCV